MIRFWTRLMNVGLVVLAALLVGTPAANAGEWYRYQDDNGVLVMSQYIPAEHAHRGYTVVDDNGRALRVVSRQLNAEEIAARDIERARDAELEAQLKAARQHDRELMQLYATPDEVGFARDRRLASIDETISTLLDDIQQLRAKQSLYETQAAEQERGLMPVSKDTLVNLESNEKRISEALREIEARRQERSRILEDFDRDLKRVYRLYGLPLPIAAN